jgi:hypothetical protein
LTALLAGAVGVVVVPVSHAGLSMAGASA